MYSIINSTNHYYKPESIQIQITQDNKCIIQSLLNNASNTSNNIKSDIPPNSMANNNLNNGQIESNNNNLINKNSVSITQDQNNENYNNNINNQEENINNNDDNLIISFSNISEITKTNNNSIFGKDNKDNLKTPSVCNYLDFTPINNRNSDNNCMNMNHNTYNNEIKKRNLNYIFNILNSDNKKLDEENNNSFLSNRKIFNCNNLNFSNSLNNTNYIKKEKKNNYVIETIKDINIINNKNNDNDRQILKIENINNIEIINNKVKNRDNNQEINKTNYEDCSNYKNFAKHLSNFSFGINNFNIVTNLNTNTKNNNNENNNINIYNDNNNINNAYDNNRLNNIVNDNINNILDNNNNLENNNQCFSPKFSEQKEVPNKNKIKFKEYKIEHLDLNDINNYKNNTKNNNIDNHYNNFQLSHGFPSFSIIDNKKPFNNYKKRQYDGIMTENEKIKNSRKQNSINQKSKYINSTGKLISHSKKEVNSYKNINYSKMNKINKEKDRISRTAYYSVKVNKNNSSNRKRHKHFKKNLLPISKNIFSNIEEFKLNNNNNTYTKNDIEINPIAQNLNLNNILNKNYKNSKKQNYTEKTRNILEKNRNHKENEKNQKVIDQNLKERIQNILGKNLNFILFKNLLNNKLKNKNQYNSEKKSSYKNIKKINNNILTNTNTITINNNNNNSFNTNTNTNYSNSNSNKKSSSVSHSNNNNNDKKYNIKPSYLIKDNKNFKKNINSKIVLMNNNLRKNIINKKNKNNINNNKNNSFTNNKLKIYTFNKNNKNRINEFNNYHNYNVNSENNEYMTDDINIVNYFSAKIRNNDNIEKKIYIENKNINKLNSENNKNKSTNDYNNENHKNYENIEFKSSNYEIKDEVYPHEIIQNNINHSFLVNKFVNKHKKPLAIIQDFSKYKRKNILY